MDYMDPDVHCPQMAVKLYHSHSVHVVPSAISTVESPRTLSVWSKPPLVNLPRPATIFLGPLLLTWINFNPSMDK